MVLSARTGPPAAVVKLALNDAAKQRLDHETLTLHALHADGRLGSWRRLIPRPISTGTFRGQGYRVDLPLDGRSAARSLSKDQFRRAALREAAAAIRVLHRATAQTLPGGRDLGREWVSMHVQELAPMVCRDRAMGTALARLRDELCNAVAGGAFAASRVHGDYWPGNLLFSGAESRRPALSGIVDWDASGPTEAPLHDVLHLALYTTRLNSRRDLGVIVSERLRGRRWSADERGVFDAYESPVWDGLSDRHALLLYWLRQMAMHIRQQASGGGWRLMVWQRRNLRPVLESL